MAITDIYQYNWNDAISNKYICDFNIYLPDDNENYQLFVDIIKKTCNDTFNEKIIIPYSTQICHKLLLIYL